MALVGTLVEMKTSSRGTPLWRKPESKASGKLGYLAESESAELKPLKNRHKNSNIIDVGNHASHPVWHVTYMTDTHAEMHLSAVSIF